MPEQIPNKKSAQEDRSEFQTEKLFWKKVAEEIKETDFRRIYETIFPDIESGDYALARQALKEELRKIIAEKSPTMYNNTDQRGSALLVLKEEFYKIFPEIEDLTRETKEESESEVKDPTVRIGEPVEMNPSAEGEFREGFRSSYLVVERTWSVPEHNELIPGLIITFLDREENRLETMELLKIPQKGEDGDFFVKVKWSDATGLIKLANFGLMAYSRTSLWNSRYTPARWEMKKEKR